MAYERKLMWVEIIGTIAIVASLLFVGLQIKQTQEIARATMRLEITTASQNVVDMAAENPGAFAVMQGERKPRDREEYWQAYVLTRAALRGYENQVYQYRQGFLDQSEWRGIRVEIRTRLAQPFIRARWEESREVFSAEFQAVVDEVESD